eukprot:GFUD01035186.1.p1 GENE.GFUD01035186.1~~GFUD01035186.1.p1  ORF type:complete len:434 (+),score=73.22 GFUD01035186.1:47-1348(+)
MHPSVNSVNCKYGRIVSHDGRLELWMSFAGASSTPGAEYLVLSWNIGNCSLVLSVPHAGTLGSDLTPAGNLLCPSGHVLESRQGSLQHPVKHPGKDTGTDVIAAGIESLLAKDGMRPHVVECHMHRNKVEVNVDISKKAVQHRGSEGEFIHSMYHRWISQAIQLSRECGDIGAVLLVDLHGHGHPHNYIELGYRVPGHMLNEIAKENRVKSSKKMVTLSQLEELKYFSIPDSYLDKNLEDSEEGCQNQNWRTIVTSPVKHEFTMIKLIKRKFGTSSDAIKEGLMGQTSFAGCLSKYLSHCTSIKDVACIPSQKRPSPGRLGYYIGGYTVLKHAKWKGVDAVQVELPISVRTQAVEKREAVTVALSKGIQEFHRMHYQSSIGNSRQGQNREILAVDEDSEEEAAIIDHHPHKQTAVKVPLCQVKWLWKGKKLLR